jgi:hypothetical protein
MRRRYLFGGVLLCIAIAWALTSPPLPPTTSPPLSQAFLRIEPPAMVAFFYKLWANMAGWLPSEQDKNSYSFYAPAQRDPNGGQWACSITKYLYITLRPTSWGGTRVSMTVSGERPILCPGLTP